MASVLLKFGDMLNSFHDATDASSNLTITKTVDGSTSEVKYIDDFFKKFIALAGVGGIVLTETGKRTTGFPGAYLCMCLVGTYALKGDERWHRTGCIGGEGLATMEALKAHALSIGNSIGEGAAYLIAEARKPPHERCHDARKWKLARGFLQVHLNALGAAFGFTLFSRTEDPSESAKRLLFSGKRCVSAWQPHLAN